MAQICRLCFKIDSTDPKQFTNMDNKQFRTQMKAVMPEIDIDTVACPLICSDCADFLSQAYTFKSKCLENDNRIKDFLTDGNKINLEEVLMEKCIEHVVVEQGQEETHDIKVEIQEFDVTFDTPDAEETLIEENIEKINTDSSPKTKNDKEQCKLCRKSFKFGRRWFDHVKSHFAERYVCVACFRGFNIKSEFLTHRKTEHDEDLPAVTKCKICNKKFMYAVNLEKHMKKHEEDNLECKECHLRVSSTARMIEHMRVHTGERPYQCNFCGKAFAQNSTLSTHVRSIHMSDRPYSCEICGKTFPVRGAYTAHMKVHEPLEKNCVCHFCGRGFRQQSCLRKHLKWHIGDRNFVCQVCKKGFVNNHGLKKHMRMHNGDRPYECHLCGKRFTQSGNKKIHLKSCSRRQLDGGSVISKNAECCR